MSDLAKSDGAAPARMSGREADLLEHLEALERLFDQRYRIPGTPVRFGMDAILGLVPVAGDTVSAAVALYLVWLSRRAGADASIRRRMIGNVFVDYLIGLVPILGNIGDLFFKANTRNLRLLKEHLARTAPPRSAAPPAPAHRP
ncbi:MAG TPA: DUF4112 domain-containing protein [Afifellaceae bacterium]|nr:DUF4112 domain-containing protein [Afifellaceae bacterium]